MHDMINVNPDVTRPPAVPFNLKYAIFACVKWIVTFYGREVETALLELPSGVLAKFIRYAERMEVHGPDLGMPHTRAMGNGLFELRVKSAEGIGRIFYCALVGRKIVFLHHFMKKTRKTPRRELDVARRRLQEVKRWQVT